MIDLNSEKSGILNSGDNDDVKLIILNYLSFVSILNSVKQNGEFETNYLRKAI